MKYLTRRQKWASVIGILALLFAQIMPYKAFFAPKVSVDHLQCVELSKAPECASEKVVYAYEVSKDGTSLQKIDAYSSCYGYFMHPKMSHDVSDVFQLIAALIIGLDVILIGVLLCNIVKRLKDKIVDWWETEGDDEA
jgi:hypothetical protein